MSSPDPKTLSPQKITVTFERQELDQLLEGLAEKAESWEQIGEALRLKRTSDGKLFIADEITHPSEADLIASRYRTIMDHILEQTETQSKGIGVVG